MISGDHDEVKAGGRVRELAGGAYESAHVLPKLERYRAYLLMVANEVMRPGLQGKVGASDLVQETFLEAQEHLPAFRGASPQDVRAWLRRILECRLSNIRRSFFRTEKRAICREVSLDHADSNREASGAMLTCPLPSPSNHAIGRELANILEGALGRIPARSREAIALRNKQGLSFREVGERLGCTEDAARKLWGRAILQLKEQLGDSP